MSTNKKFRIQNGVDVTGELTVNDVVIIRADGTIVAGAIADAVSSLVDEGALTGSGSSIVDSDSQIFIDVNSNTVAIASETATRISDIASLQTQIDSLGVNSDTQAEVDSLQTQIDSIVGASPETLDTLVEIVSAFEGADSDIQSLLAANSSSLSANTAAIGVETTQRIAGDVTLQQNLDAEVTRATAAELANAAAVAAEAATRGAAVSALQASQFTYSDSDGWTGNLIPSADNEYALGSPDRVWKDLYIGPGSLYINGTKILEDNSGTITMYADAGQNLSFGATGGGNIDLNAGDESVQLKSDLVMSVGETISTVGGAPTKFGGDVDMGTHQVSNLGTPVDPSDAATKEYVDGLNAEGTVSGDKVFEDSVTIQGNLSVEGTTTTLDSQTLKVADNIIDLNSNVSTGTPVLNAGIRIMRGDEPAVQLRWNELDDRWEVYDGVTATPIAVTSTDVIAEGDDKLFFTVVRAREAVSQDIADAVAAEATARGAAIDAEIARATSAEQANAAAIAAETTAREDAVSAEETARIAGDATVQASVDAEQAARIAADLSEAQTRAAAVSDLQSQLNTVTGSDLSSIQTQLDAIVGTSPETLDTIQEVVAAFEGADSDLIGLITGNSSTITAVNQSLTQETVDRTFFDAAEKQQREDADSDLQSAIDSLSATVSSNNAAKSSAISTETAARVAGDEGEAASREAAITAEATARVAGDATVQAAVDAETARAAAAEASISSDVTAETSRATAAEQDLQNQINQVEATGATHPLFSTMGDLPDASANHGMFAHVHSEGAAYFAHAGQWVELAKSADLANLDLSSIQSQIDAILGSSPETLDTLQEIVAAFESADGDLQTLMTTNSSDISTIKSLIGEATPKYFQTTHGLYDPLTVGLNAGSTFSSTQVYISATEESDSVSQNILQMIDNGLTQNVVHKIEFINNGHVITGYNSSNQIKSGLNGGDGYGGSGTILNTDPQFSGGTAWRLWINTTGTDMINAPPVVDPVLPSFDINPTSATDSNYQSFDTVKMYGSTGALVVTGDFTHTRTSTMFDADGNVVSDDFLPISTDATTLVGAINELHAEMADNSATSAAVQTETDARVAAVSAEETARIAGDAVNANAIVSETNARAAAVANETQARISADNALDAKIVAETAARQSTQTAQSALISTQSTALNTEISNRTSADSGLQTQIDDIVADNAARTASGATVEEVNAVQDAVDAEVVRAQLAEQANASAIVTGDAALQAQLDAIVGTSPETLDTLQEIVTAYSNADGTLQGLIDTNTGTLAALQTTIGAENVPLITPDIGETITYEVEYAGRQFYAVGDNTNVYVYDSVDPSAPVATIHVSNSADTRFMDCNSEALFINRTDHNHRVYRYEWSDLVLGITSWSKYYEPTQGHNLYAIAVSEEYIYAYETSGTDQLHKQPLSSSGSSDTVMVYNENGLGGHRLRVFGDKLYSFDYDGTDRLLVWDIRASDGYPINVHSLTSGDQNSDDIMWGQGHKYGAFEASSTLIAVGAPYDDLSGTDVGSVYLFNPDNLNEAHTKLYPPAEYNLNAMTFGWSVTVTDTRLIVGALDTQNRKSNVSGSNGLIFIYDATNLLLPPLVIEPPATGLSHFPYSMFEKSNRLLVRSSSESGLYVYDLVNMDQPPVHLVEPTNNMQNGTFGEIMGISPAATVTQSITDTIIPSQGLGNSINYLESKRQELRADLEANLAAIQSNDADIASIAADVATNTANIATNAAAIVAVNNDRTAFEASVNADRQSHRDAVQADIDQVNADRTSFEASITADRQTFEDTVNASQAQFIADHDSDYSDFTSSVSGTFADTNLLQNEIRGRMGTGHIALPQETTSISYNKDVGDQYYTVIEGNDEFFVYTSAEYVENQSVQVGLGTRVVLPSTYNAQPEGNFITRDHVIVMARVANTSTSDREIYFLVYELATIDSSSLPIAEVHADLQNVYDLNHIRYDGGSKVLIGNVSLDSVAGSARIYDVPSLVAGNAVFIETTSEDLPTGVNYPTLGQPGHGNFAYRVDWNDTHVFVGSTQGEDKIFVYDRTDLSYVTTLQDSVYGGGDIGANFVVSNTMVVAVQQAGSYYAHSNDGRMMVWDASNLNVAPVYLHDSSILNSSVYKRYSNAYYMYNPNRKLAVSDDWIVFGSAYDVVMIPKENALNNDFPYIGINTSWYTTNHTAVESQFKGTVYNNEDFSNIHAYQFDPSTWGNSINRDNWDYPASIQIQNDKLIITSRSMRVSGGTSQDSGTVYIHDLNNFTDLVNGVEGVNLQLPVMIEESGFTTGYKLPAVSAAGTITQSVTETFNPNDSLTAAVNYLNAKKEELLTAVEAVTGSSTLVQDLQTIESNIDFKLLAQDQRYDSDKAEQIALYDSANAEQTAIYAAANAEQSSIYDSANAAHVAYFEQYTSGETAARELADQNLQTQITSNDGDIVGLQSQIDTIVGTSPETLDTLQEIVTYFDNADNTLQGVVTSNETKVNSLLASLDEMGVDAKGIFGDDVTTAADASHGDIFFDRSTGKIYKGVITDASAGSEILSSGHGTWMGTSHQTYSTKVWLDFDNRRISDSQPNYNTFTYTFAEPINISTMNFTSQYYIDITSVTYEDGTVESLGIQNYVRPIDETRKIASIFLTCTNPSHKTYGWSGFNGITVSTFNWEEITVEMLGHVLLANAGDDQVREELMVNISALESYADLVTPLDTSSQTLTGAINELNTSVQSITGSDTQFLDDIAANQTNIAGHDSDFVDVRGRLDVIEDTSVPNLQSQIDVHSGQISTEVADRTSGDAALQSQIDNIVGTSPETLDTLQEVVSTFQNADNDLQALITGNTSIVSTHTTQIATLDNQIHAGAGLTVPNMPTEVSRWVYQDQYIVTISSSTDDVPCGHALVFDANAPLSPPTVLSPEGHGNHAGATSNMSTPRTAKIIRDKVVVGYPYADAPYTNSGEVYVWDLNDLSADPVVLNRYGYGTDTSDYFGFSVTGSADHNYIIVGEWGQDNTGRSYYDNPYRTDSGRVYLYDINNLTSQPVILDPTGIPSFWRANTGYSYDSLQFGRQVSVDGDYLYVTVGGYNNYGANNYNSFILMFDLTDIQAAPSYIEPSINQWSDDNDGNYFGWYSNGVAFNDNYVAVGSSYGPNASFDGLTYRHGTVYVYAKNTDGHASGSPVYALQSPDSQQSDYFGRAVAMDDTRLYVGSYGWDGAQGSNVGKVDVFDVSDGSLITTIYAYDGNANDNFAYNLSVNGGKLVVSSHGDDDNTTNSGSLYIYDTSALSGIPIKVSESFVNMDTSSLGAYDVDLTVASGAVEIKEIIIPNASLSAGINYLEGKTEELKVQVQNVNNSGALTAMSNSNRLDVVETLVSNLESADSAEQAARVAGDAGLQSQIDNLTIAASGDVSVESAARIAGDSDEAAARVAGDATVQDAVDAEVARATGVESGLQSQLDAIVGTSPETLDTLQEVVAAFEGADGDLQTLMSANASSISDLDDFVKGEAGPTGPELGFNPEVNVSRLGMSTEVFDIPPLEIGKTYEYSFVVSTGEGVIGGNTYPPVRADGSWQIALSLDVVETDTIPDVPAFNAGYKAAGLQSGVSGTNIQTQSVSKTFTATTTDYSFYAYPSYENWDMFIHSINLREYAEQSALETTATSVVEAVNELHSELDAEVLRAQTAEGVEEVRALAAEAVLQSNINTESSARLAGDAGLQSQIDTLSGTQTSDKSGLEVSIAAETARATGAENTLQSNIDAEATRAQTAEAANAAAVVTEKVRAEAVEAGLAADIAVETARATAAEVQLANHLGANFTDGSITVDGLATFNGGLYFGDGTGTIGFNSSVDHLQVLSDLDMMDNSVINVAAPVDSSDAANKAYVDATTQTVSDRVDAILNGAGESLDTIVEVVAAFENADSDIQSLITSNSSSVTANTNAINAEVAARQQAITDEATARANADSDLSAGLSNETSRALSAEGVLTSDLAAEVARATSAETGLASDIAAETSRATAAEGVNATAISAETTRATTVEASLAQDIADEALRAQGAEAVLTSDVSTNATAISSLQSQVAGVSTSSGSSTIEMTAEVDMKSNKVTGMADPTAAQDAATKSYVDASVATEATSRTTEDTSLQSNIDAANARIDAILNGSVESLDTVVEVVSAFEGADSNIQNLITANASTISQNATAIATEATARANADSDETALRTAADAVLTADIAATNARTAGISVDSDSNIEMSVGIEMGQNNIKGVNDIYAARGFIDTVESNDLKVQTGTADFEGSIVNFGSATITGTGFSSATDTQIDNHINVSTANAGEFVKWTGTDYEWTDLVSGRLATDQLQVDTGGSIAFMGPGGTLDVQDAIVMFSGSDVRMPTPTDAGQGANKGYVDDADSDLNASLSTAISNEESRATTAEGVLTTNLSNEISRATSAEATLASDISAEETRALAAEAAEASARTDADSDLQSAIDAEVARATAAEGVNAQAIVDETSSRTSADTTLQSNIDTVSGRVDAILNGSSDSLDTIVEVVAAFENADSDLQTLISSNAGSHTANAAAITAEETRALAAEGVLQSAVNAEETRATGVESGLQSQITSETAARSAADQSMKDDVDSDIAAEAALRSAGDATLQSAVDVEVARATAAEGVLQSSLDSEQSARLASDQALQSAVTAEENARVAADAVLQSAIDAEVSARTSADNTLQTNIDAIDAAVTAITNGSPETLNQLVEVVAAFEDADSDIQTLISTLGGDASALTARVSTLESEMDATETATSSNASAISAETSARVAAVQANADAITAEATARAAAITAEQNARSAAIVASESDRDSADADLQSQIDALSAEETAGKSSLQFQLTQEELARIAGDSDLTDSLAAEVARATAAESGLSSDIVAETSRATTAESSLQTQIDSILSNTDATALNSLAEIVTEFQSVDGTLTGLISSNGSRISALESGVTAIEGWTTDNLSEGTINKYWTEQRTKDCLTGGLCISYNSTTGEISIDETEAATSLTVAESHDANALGGEAPSHYRINVYDAAGNLVN